MNDVFWARKAAECAEAQREVERLREALRMQRTDRLLGLIARLAGELSRREFDDQGCVSCVAIGTAHAPGCPFVALLAEAAALAPSDDDSLV